MKDAEISVLITQGRAYKSSSFLFRMLENKAENSLQGLNIAYIAPKKSFKKAVLRNKARRRMRAAFSAVVLAMKLNTRSYSMLFMLGTPILSLPMPELRIEIRRVLEKSGIIMVS